MFGCCCPPHNHSLTNTHTQTLHFLQECDTLMKYVYKSLADSDSDLSGVMLKWHAKVAAKAGQGCIVRTMVDRKTV